MPVAAVEVDPRFYVDGAARPDAPVPGVPLYPPERYFAPPPDMGHGDKLTVITAGPDAGRVYGYVAAWDSCLLNGDERRECLRPPRSPSNYVAAMGGDTILDDGRRIATANLGGGVNHAGEGPLSMAVDHYANVATQTTRVRYGEDGYGVWLAGALWPEATWRDVATLRAASVSGDWRWRREIAAYLGDPKAWDLAGVQLVNSPGYPLYRVVASAAHPGDLELLATETVEEPMPPCAIHAPLTACTCAPLVAAAPVAVPAAPPTEEAPAPDLADLQATVAALNERVTALEDALSIADLNAELAALDDALA